MTRATRTLLVALALVAGPWPRAAAAAPTTPTTASSQSQLTNLSNKIVEASREETALIKKLDAANAKKAETAKRIAEVDKQLPAVQASLESAAARLAVVDGELAVAEKALDEANSRLRSGKDALKQRAIDAYIGRPDASMMSVGLHVTTFRQFVALHQYLNAVIATHVKVV
ncbi:MAG TPA: hypothetical protein VFB78_06265, partial [Acidimicrobiales bacterium]|nr:hypothetical protein [Acidimicrobiales bacterium]